MRFASYLPATFIRYSFLCILSLSCLTSWASESAVNPQQSNDKANQISSNATQASGSLVIIGGALRPDNAEVWQRIVQQAGGKGAKFVVIPTASGNPLRSGNSAAMTLAHYGANASVLPLDVRDQDHPYQRVVNDPTFIQQIKQAQGIFFTGGDQARITQALLQADGQRTPLLNAIWELYQRGGVIAGTSAGAAIMSKTMFYDTKSLLSTLKQGVHIGKEIAPGLGFIGDQVFVDQHVLVRGRFARMILAMTAAKQTLGLGIDENSAMLVTHQDELEILGYKGAILIDLSEVNQDPAIAEFNMRQIKIGYLDRGDKYNLRSKVLTPSPDKLPNPVDPQLIESGESVYSNDILGNTAVTDLIARMLDNHRASAIGLAFGDGTDVHPELGFEFEFKRASDTLGFLSSSSESFTVLNIHVDIRPIKIHFPWYY